MLKHIFNPIIKDITLLFNSRMIDSNITKEEYFKILNELHKQYLKYYFDLFFEKTNDDKDRIDKNIIRLNYNSWRNDGHYITPQKFNKYILENNYKLSKSNGTIKIKNIKFKKEFENIRTHLDFVNFVVFDNPKYLCQKRKILFFYRINWRGKKY